MTKTMDSEPVNTYPYVMVAKVNLLKPETIVDHGSIISTPNSVADDAFDIALTYAKKKEIYFRSFTEYSKAMSDDTYKNYCVIEIRYFDTDMEWHKVELDNPNFTFEEADAYCSWCGCYRDYPNDLDDHCNCDNDLCHCYDEECVRCEYWCDTHNIHHNIIECRKC